MLKNEKDLEIEQFWSALGDIPFDLDGDDELILGQDFKQFPKGTLRSDIWEYVDQYHSEGLAYLMLERQSKKVKNEHCNECGKSVEYGSGRFVNRITDFNDERTRSDMGKKYPLGNYICENCESKNHQ